MPPYAPYSSKLRRKVLICYIIWPLIGYGNNFQKSLGCCMMNLGYKLDISYNKLALTYNFALLVFFLMTFIINEYEICKSKNVKLSFRRVISECPVGSYTRMCGLQM